MGSIYLPPAPSISCSEACFYYLNEINATAVEWDEKYLTATRWRGLNDLLLFGHGCFRQRNSDQCQTSFFDPVYILEVSPCKSRLTKENCPGPSSEVSDFAASETVDDVVIITRLSKTHHYQP